LQKGGQFTTVNEIRAARDDVAGLKVARDVLKFYSEATEQTLLMEVEEFRRKAPLPPDSAIACIDTPDRKTT
jgi:Mg2+/Co2+ transporter CorC